MMDWVRRNPLMALLAALAAVLAMVVAAEALLGPGSGATAVLPQHAMPAEAKLLPPMAVVSADQAYPETTARPLFIPTRTPAPEAPAAGKNAFQKGQFVLQGVIAVGSNRVAMLREKSTGKIHRVQAGGDVNGIKIGQIANEQVTLTMGADREVLPLLVQKTAPAGNGSPPPLPPASGPFMPQAQPAAVQPPAQPGAAVPGQPFVPPTPLAPGQPANPLARPGALPTLPTLTPEELLARRRARRAGPGQQPQ